MGGAPGSWRRFGPQEVRLIAQEEAVSLHEPGLANGLELAQALNMLPEEILIYGVEPGCCEPGQELSPAVTLALPGLVDAILSDLLEWTN
jgi:hydrogenase maturation protease